MRQQTQRPQDDRRSRRRAGLNAGPGSRRFVQALLAAASYERWPGQVEDPRAAVLPTDGAGAEEGQP